MTIPKDEKRSSKNHWRQSHKYTDPEVINRYIVVSASSDHVSLLFQTLLNAQGLYAATVLPAYAILAISLALAFVSAGGSAQR